MQYSVCSVSLHVRLTTGLFPSVVIIILTLSKVKRDTEVGTGLGYIYTLSYTVTGKLVSYG